MVFLKCLGGKVFKREMGLSNLNERFQMIADTIGQALDMAFENQRGLARQNGIDGFPVGLIEVAQLQLLQNGACLARFRDCRLEHLLLFGFGL